MLKHLRIITSLSNLLATTRQLQRVVRGKKLYPTMQETLSHTSQHVRGQISTLLLMVIVGLVCLMLVTMNVGINATKATQMQVAADEASLALASQLATKSYVSYVANDYQLHRKESELGSWLKWLKPVLELIGIVIVVYCPALWWVTGIIFAVCEGVSAAITGGNVLLSAIIGFVEGALIGYGIGSAAAHAGGFSSWSAYSSFVGPLTAEASSAVASTLITSGVLAAIGTAGANYSEIKGRAVGLQVAADFTKQFSQMGEKDMLRESTIFAAMSKVVDDPNTVRDAFDANNNGDTQEMIPYFTYWWDRRMNQMAGHGAGIGDLVDEFFRRMKISRDNFDVKDLPFIARTEIEGFDGEIVGFLRTLESLGQSGSCAATNPKYDYPCLDTSFWVPGPTQAELDAYNNAASACDQQCSLNQAQYQNECSAQLGPNASQEAMNSCIDNKINTCVNACVPPLESYDEIDWTNEYLNAFDALVDNDLEILKDNRQEFIKVWRTWFASYYPVENENGNLPPADSTFYEKFTKMLHGVNDPNSNFQKGMYNWQAEIEEIRLSLPDCVYSHDTDGVTRLGVTNPPCKGPTAGLDAGGPSSINTDLADEFVSVQGKIQEIIDDVEDAQQAMEEFYYGVMAAYGVSSTTNKNPATYGPWYDAQGGAHTVTVEVGDFRIPDLVTTVFEHRWKTNYYFDVVNNADNGSHTWVKVTREDPSKLLGFLGKWNPLAGKIIRISRAYFSTEPQSVGLAK